MTVVVVQALFRHLQLVPPDLQHLHRLRDLCTRRRGDLPRIPRFPRRRHTRNHSVRRRLRRRTHVSLTTLGDPAIRAHDGVHHLAAHLRRPASPYGIGDKPRHASPFTLPRGIRGQPTACNRRRQPRGHVGPRRPRRRHRAVGPRSRVRPRPGPVDRRVRRAG